MFIDKTENLFATEIKLLHFYEVEATNAPLTFQLLQFHFFVSQKTAVNKIFREQKFRDQRFPLKLKKIYKNTIFWFQSQATLFCYSLVSLANKKVLQMRLDYSISSYFKLLNKLIFFFNFVEVRKKVRCAEAILKVASV